ncbi:uncharacterized protein LOC126842910 isoform X2 [Adelges cooleyi]|uniref:uncharacterized protein LOC126842910 isoform X2 n=1 Tax=Adelges cooleyi TaxID=133065 RepID=UPI00217FE693|nr:uncharacterized protein LOC126842910 isoform X2 [Adelges cooleyi]
MRTALSAAITAAVVVVAVFLCLSVPFSESRPWPTSSTDNPEPSTAAYADYGDPSPADETEEPSTYQDQQSEWMYDEPEKVYGEPEKVYGEPEKVYGEPEKVYGEPEKVYGKPEKNYEVDEADSVLSDGRVHGEQPTTAAGSSAETKKSGYVVDGKHYRKYRVEEETPDGFIVGEYGVVNHNDGITRGVRYTADSSINPRVIYDALAKFLTL